MKMRTFLTGLFASVGAASLLVCTTTAQNAAPASAEATPPRLPYGVDDVLKLSRAQVNEDVTLNYIRNSGTIYNLGPNDIVYLRNEGVSDRVINTMLDQRRTVPAETAAQTAVTSAPATPQYAPAYVQPAPVYAQPPPAPPASSVYVIPYPYAGYRYPNYYPYYYRGGYPYYGSSVVFGIGFGTGYRYGGYYGGYYRGHCGSGPYRSYGHHH